MARHPITKLLPDDHLDKVNHLIKATSETASYLKDCEDCGIDVEHEKMKNAQQAGVAQAIKAKFYPGE